MVYAKQANGTHSTLKIAYETTYNEDPADLATKAVQLPLNTNGLKSSQNTTAPQTITGRRDPVEPILGNKDVSGDIVFPVGATAFGHILKMLFGSPTSTQDATDTTKYTHAFKLAEEQPSMVIEKGHPDVGVFFKYNGVKVNQLSMTVGGDGDLIATVSMMGASEVKGTTTICSSPTKMVVDRFDNFMASLKVGDKLTADVTELALTLNMNLDGDTQVLGSKGFRTAVNEGIAALSGTLTAMFKDGSYIDLAENNTVTSMELTLAKGDFSLTILFPEMMFARSTPSIDGPKGIKQQLSFNAFYAASAEDTSVMATLVNKTASY